MARAASASSGCSTLVLWVSNVEQSVQFYRDILGFEVKTRYPNAAFMRIPGSPDDHHLGLFEQRGATGPDERAVRMYHSAWEVGELTDLVRARARLAEAGALVGQSDHGVSLSLYAKDPDGLEFEVFWTVPGGEPVRHARARPGARAGPPGHRDARGCEVLTTRAFRAALPLVGLACVTLCLLSLLSGSLPLPRPSCRSAPRSVTFR